MSFFSVFSTLSVLELITIGVAGGASVLLICELCVSLVNWKIIVQHISSLCLAIRNRVRWCITGGYLCAFVLLGGQYVWRHMLLSHTAHNIDFDLNDLFMSSPLSQVHLGQIHFVIVGAWIIIITIGIVRVWYNKLSSRQEHLLVKMAAELSLAQEEVRSVQKELQRMQVMVCDVIATYPAKPLEADKLPHQEVMDSVHTRLKPVERWCRTCRKNHLAEEVCPAKNHRCSKCVQLGHWDEYCPNIAVTDEAGRLRTLIEPKAGATIVTHKQDRTNEQRLETVEGVIQKLLDMTKQRSETAKQRRIRQTQTAKRNKAGIPPKVPEVGNTDPMKMDQLMGAVQTFLAMEEDLQVLAWSDDNDN
eukprot:Lankesteria_metandrocarpae@DN5481_c0_g1_i3.p1